MRHWPWPHGSTLGCLDLDVRDEVLGLGLSVKAPVLSFGIGLEDRIFLVSFIYPESDSEQSYFIITITQPNNQN